MGMWSVSMLPLAHFTYEAGFTLAAFRLAHTNSGFESGLGQCEHTNCTWLRTKTFLKRWSWYNYQWTLMQLTLFPTQLWYRLYLTFILSHIQCYFFTGSWTQQHSIRGPESSWCAHLASQDNLHFQTIWFAERDVEWCRTFLSTGCSSGDSRAMETWCPVLPFPVGVMETSRTASGVAHGPPCKETCV